MEERRLRQEQAAYQSAYVRGGGGSELEGLPTNFFFTTCVLHQFLASKNVYFCDKLLKGTHYLLTQLTHVLLLQRNKWKNSVIPYKIIFFPVQHSNARQFPT